MKIFDFIKDMHDTIGVFILLSKQNDEVPLLRNGYCGVQTVRTLELIMMCHVRRQKFMH